MKQEKSLDLGSVKVHKKAIAEIAVSAIADLDGVGLIPKDMMGVVRQWLNQEDIPGITVFVDENQDVTVNMDLQVRYGMNIPDIAREVQDAVKAAIRRTVNIYVKDVNVNIQGIERGEK